MKMLSLDISGGRPIFGFASGSFKQRIALGLLCGLLSCLATYGASAEDGEPERATIKVRESDTLQVSFPSAPDLNGTHRVRRDGRISLPLVGEVSVVGLTPPELEDRIKELYASQLVSNEVSVTVVSSSYPIYVQGAVLRPGKLEADRPLTALQAILEAGGYDQSRANLKKVQVKRLVDGKWKHITVNLHDVINGNKTDTFPLEPDDIVFVPEKTIWF